MVRVPARQYHSLLIESDWLVICESTLGPFDAEATLPAPWSPPGGAEAEIARYVAALTTAATALRLAKSPLKAVLIAAGLGVAAIWAGIVLAYDSFYWPPGRHGWPVSFFVVTLVVGGYLVTYLRRRDRGEAQPAMPPEALDTEQVCSPA